ncbi:MAG: SIMPL domain-containing protein [Vicinamibacteria bacterium]
MRYATLLLSTLLVPVAHAGEDCCERPSITVTGQGEVRTAPDEAVLRLSVSTQARDLAPAKARNDESVKATLALLKKAGVEADQVQTDALEISPRYTSPTNGDKPELVGYLVKKSIVVVLRDLSRADAVLTEAVQAGVNGVEGFDLRLADPRPSKDKARALAIRAAKEKALALAAEIGQTIGKAITITEGVDQPFGTRFTNVVSFDRSDDGGDGSFAAGQNVVRATVTVRFELQ